MSEYQYYEFRAIDRPLTKAEMAELRKVSSRGEISTTSFVNEYHYGDFKGSPDKWMERYFDAFIYYANWGTKTCKLRLPASVLSFETVAPYCGGESLWAETTDEHTILTFELEPYDSPHEWPEYSEMMGSLIGLRAELACGDLRPLYLGWLIDRDVEYCDDADEDLVDIEPPVPAGLQDLTASQQALVEFFEIDPDLLAAAASTSPPLVLAKTSPDDLRRWVADLPGPEKDAYLLQVLSGAGAKVSLEMDARFQKAVSPSVDVPDKPRLRSDIELQALKETYREARINAEEALKAEEKVLRLARLAKRLPEVWAEVEAHMASKKVNQYDQAVRLLQGIQELAESGGVPDFANRIAEIRARHSTKRALLDRLTALE